MDTSKLVNGMTGWRRQKRDVQFVINWIKQPFWEPTTLTFSRAYNFRYIFVGLKSYMFPWFWGPKQSNRNKSDGSKLSDFGELHRVIRWRLPLQGNSETARQSRELHLPRKSKCQLPTINSQGICWFFRGKALKSNQLWLCEYKGHPYPG